VSLRSLKVTAFEKRHRSKDVFKRIGGNPDEPMAPFTELVFEVLTPAEKKYRLLTWVLSIGYVVFFLALVILSVAVMVGSVSQVS
jgi:hypothetical protein